MMLSSADVPETTLKREAGRPATMAPPAATLRSSPLPPRRAVPEKNNKSQSSANRVKHTNPTEPHMIHVTHRNVGEQITAALKAVSCIVGEAQFEKMSVLVVVVVHHLGWYGIRRARG